MLPQHRQIMHGRTFSAPWDAASYGAAIEVGRRPFWWALLKWIRRVL
jgi:hypothetical protein